MTAPIYALIDAAGRILTDGPDILALCARHRRTEASAAVVRLEAGRMVRLLERPEARS